MKKGTTRMLPPLLLSKILVIAAFSVLPSYGSHQLSNVEKRHHELGAQRNDLFREMQELLKQQQDEVAECWAALARSQSGAPQVGGGEGDPDTASQACAAPPLSASAQASAPAASQRRGTIATIAGAERAAGRAVDGTALGEGGAEGEDSLPMEEIESADFANYFYSYAELEHQKQMLEDDRRMEAYRNSMLLNRDAFEGKTVLDVGSGSGVLAIFAAQAGAKKVYAVEYTDMAKHARTMVEKNGFGDVIQVIQGSAESIQLPEKVDVIVSEWMGYFLLRESMLDSVVVARDKWLKDTGVMFPSHATMVWAPVDDGDQKYRRDTDYQNSGWSRIKKQRESGRKFTKKLVFNLASPFPSLSSPPPSHVCPCGTCARISELDLHTCSLEDTKGLEKTLFSFPLRDGAPPVTGFAGWFDVSFRGRDGVAPLQRPVEFSTAPAAGYTHWGQQQVFYLQEPVVATEDATVEGTVSMVRQANNPRLYNVEHRLSFASGTADSQQVSSVYKIP
ncbi:unnamed protein product [Ectocarpus sp. 8 AP-2014]